jgi:putative peptidoglycan lipid II flippase
MIAALRTRLGSWTVRQGRTVDRSVLAAMLTVGGCSGLAKLATTGQALLVAQYFGTGDAMDAFLIAYVLPFFAVDVLAGSFGAAFIPTYVQIRAAHGHAAARRLLGTVTAAAVALLVAVGALLALSGPFVLPLLASGFSHEKLGLTYALFVLLLPMLVISGLSKLWAATLNASGSFALPSLVPVLTPVCAALLLLFAASTLGIQALAVGTVVGAALEAVVLACALLRHDLSPVPRWLGAGPFVRQVAQQYAPTVCGLFIMSSGLLIDQAMAATLGPGSVSALSYGNRLVALLLGIGPVLGTALLPYFSTIVAVGDWQHVRQTLRQYIVLALVLTIPITILALSMSETLVAFLFQRGAFTTEDARLVSQIQSVYFVQVPFYAVGTILVRMISSLKASYILTQAAIINVVVNVAFDYILMQAFGVVGIALSTTIVYIVSCGYCLLRVRRLLRAVP